MNENSYVMVLPISKEFIGWALEYTIHHAFVVCIQTARFVLFRSLRHFSLIFVISFSLLVSEFSFRLRWKQFLDQNQSKPKQKKIMRLGISKEFTRKPHPEVDIRWDILLNNSLNCMKYAIYHAHKNSNMKCDVLFSFGVHIVEIARYNNSEHFDFSISMVASNFSILI